MERFVLVVKEKDIGIYYMGAGNSAISRDAKKMHRCYAKNLKEFFLRYGYKSRIMAEKSWAYKYCRDVKILGISL